MVSKTEEFKRPDHPDFWNDKERKDNSWTGTRHNTVTDDIEFWIAGDCVEKISQITREINPASIAQAHVRIFKMNPFNIEE